MKSLRIVFGLSISVAVAAAACSSSDNNGPSPDAGADSSFVAPDTSTPSCGLGSLTCGNGQTCCLTLNLPPTGTCQASSAPCTGIPIQCMKGSDCAAGQVCCGSLPAGFDAAAINLDAGLDASAFNTEAGLAGFDAAALSGLGATCQTSCPAGAPQLCGSDTECTSPDTCQANAGLAGLLGGAADSGPLASIPPSLISGVLNLKTCTPPDAGSSSGDGSTTTTSDAASDAPAASDSAPSEASVSDAPTGG
jgi:hypothetical protein